MPETTLIINADDYGYNSKTNAAIAYCFQKQLINSTTMMVNTAAFEEALALAKQYRFQDKIGIHLNITEGRPLTDLSGTGLTNSAGLFIKKAAFNPLLLFSPAVKNKIRTEVRAQYDKLVAHQITPTHLDSHHHVHMFPWFAPLFIELAKQTNQRIRVKKNILRKNLIKTVYGAYLNRQYRKYQINFSDRYESMVTFLQEEKKKILPALSLKSVFIPVSNTTNWWMYGKKKAIWKTGCCS